MGDETEVGLGTKSWSTAVIDSSMPISFFFQFCFHKFLRSTKDHSMKIKLAWNR